MATKYARLYVNHASGEIHAYDISPGKASVGTGDAGTEDLYDIIRELLELRALEAVLEGKAPDDANVRDQRNEEYDTCKIWD